jgi:hypothetical protein
VPIANATADRLIIGNIGMRTRSLFGKRVPAADQLAADRLAAGAGRPSWFGFADSGAGPLKIRGLGGRLVFFVQDQEDV